MTKLLLLIAATAALLATAPGVAKAADCVMVGMMNPSLGERCQDIEYRLRVIEQRQLEAETRADTQRQLDDLERHGLRPSYGPNLYGPYGIR